MHQITTCAPALPRYRCHKVVEAAKINSVTITLADDGAPESVREECRATRWLALDGIKDAVPVTAEWYEQHKAEPGGYFVRYADGYTSFSPAKAFEEGYAPVDAAQPAINDAMDAAVREILSLRKTVVKLAKDLRL